MQRQTLASSLVCFLLSLFWTSALWAFDIECDVYGLGWYFNAGVGRTQPNVDSSNYVGTGPGWPNDHYKGDDIHGAPMLVVGTGYTWGRYYDWFPDLSLGAQFTYTGQAKISGTINQYSLAQFENYSYNYKFRRMTLLAVGKADIYNLANFMPYLTAGLGVSFNKTSNYEEQPLSHVTPRISPGFGSATNNYFSYMVGVGVDYALCDNLWLSLEYNYGNFGYAQTGDGANTFTLTGFNYSNQQLKNKLTANNFLFSVTYLLNPESGSV